MAVSAVRVISDSFREEAWRSPKGKGGTREWHVTGAATIDDATFADIPGVPKDGDPWSAAVPECVCIGVSGSWISHNRPGETNGRVRLVATYGPPEIAILNGDPAPRTPGEKWSEYEKETLTQNVMYAKNTDYTNIIGVPINNGSGTDIKIGIMRLKVSKAYAENATIPVSLYLSLSRPPKLNAAEVTVPSIWGRNNTLLFARGQLLYQGAEIKTVNRLIIVTHELLASDNWDIEWNPTDEKGAPVDGVVEVGKIYDEASFGGLW